LASFVLALEYYQKEELIDFFKNSVGIESLSTLFIEEAIDLETMLNWKYPQRDLKNLGVKQEGVVQKIVSAIKDEQEKRGMNLVTTFPCTMYSGRDLSELGTLVAVHAERLLKIAQSQEENKTRKTELTSTVTLETGNEFTFTFSIDPSDFIQ